MRVEASVDDGKTWMLCDLKHPEQPTRYGKYWCWCFWQINLEMMELLKCKEIVVRAWDVAMNTQPQHLTWNVMVRLGQAAVLMISAITASGARPVHS